MSIRGCLIVENPSEYCSIDPYELGEGAIFASKARLWIKPGAYPVSAKDALSDLAIRIKTRFGETSLSPAGEELFSIRRTEAEEENVDAATKRVEVKAAYVGDRLSLDRFFLRTSRSSDEKFRLGDPEDVGSFYAAGRNLYISVDGESPLFPGLIGETIHFAPCAMHGLTDNIFLFELEDGSTVRLNIRAINGSNEIGYYMGRLVSAEWNLDGRKVSIIDRNRLAFFGSTRSWAEMAIPTLAVRTADEGERCGFIFDASQWDTPKAVNGYVAYEMTCEDGVGKELNLQSVSYPGNFVLP